MKWSQDGQYLAVAGGSESGSVIRVWRVKPWDNTNGATNASARGPPSRSAASTASAAASGAAGVLASSASATTGSGSHSHSVVSTSASTSLSTAASGSPPASGTAAGTGTGVMAGGGGSNASSPSSGTGTGIGTGIVPSRKSAFSAVTGPAAAAAAQQTSPAAPAGSPTNPASTSNTQAAPTTAKTARRPVVCHGAPVFESKPYREYLGHETHIVDLAWSRSNLLISASMDSFVRLWHPSQPTCLHKFQHPDCVTAVAFHPSEDNYFLTGCLDKKLRVWSLETGRVVMWHQMPSMVTAVSFSPDARLVAAGLYNGLVTLHRTDGLIYQFSLEARNRKGKHRRGRKVTGLEFTPHGGHLLVTTNDSRVRLFRMDDFAQIAKYSGLRNSNMQIRATFDSTGERLIAGSEDKRVYIWRTRNDQMSNAGHGKGSIHIPGLTGDERVMGSTGLVVGSDYMAGGSGSGSGGGIGGGSMDAAAALGSLPGPPVPAYPGLPTSSGAYHLHSASGGPGSVPTAGAGEAEAAVSKHQHQQASHAALAAGTGKCVKVRSCEWFVADDGLQPSLLADQNAGPGASSTSPRAGAAGGAPQPGQAGGSSGGFFSWLCGCCGAGGTTSGTSPQAPKHPAGTSLPPAPPHMGPPSSITPASAPAYSPGPTPPSGGELNVDDLEDIVARAEFNAYFASGRTATTVAVFAPAATLNICRPFSAVAQWKKPVTLPAEVHDAIPSREDELARHAFEAEVRASHFIIVAADSRGFLRVYENTGPRFAAP